MLAVQQDDHRQKDFPAADAARWRLLLGPLDNASSTLRMELYRRFAGAILDGRLSAGTILPSTRALAETLHIARNTVIHAYEQLSSEGLIETRNRSGHRVAKIEGFSPQAPPAPGGGVLASPTYPWKDRMVGSVASLPRLDRDRRWRGCRYPFIYGQYDRDLFPLADWREAQRQSLAVTSIRDWGGEPYDDDDPDLIEQIRSRILPAKGIWATPDEVLLTSGVQSSVSMIATLLLATGFHCAIEDPCNPEIRAAVRMRTSRIQAVDVDAEGLRVGDLSPGLTMILCGPRSQYPTTAEMSAPRRAHLHRYARENGSVIVEIDVDGEAFPGHEQLPALKASDPNGQVIHVGDFSKGLSPALRVGFLVAPACVVQELRLIRRLISRSPATNNQRTLAEFVKRGYFDRLMRRMRSTYEARAHALSDAVAEHLPDATLAPIGAGCSGWLQLPDGVDGKSVAERLLDERVYVESGHKFFQHRPPHSFLQLGYSCLGEADIDAGIRLVGTAVRDMTGLC